ncbi:MAG: CDP-alcohol phosphatidyltransferase family protein [Acidobacteria bacterium]|nr:CDP-alcohol phosphatidyltransferase family protein [Acidobacteriota bacterium]
MTKRKLQPVPIENPKPKIKPPPVSSRIVTVPNLLTMFRMALIPVFVSLLYSRKFAWALGVFVLAGLTDGLDGLLARRLNQGSQLGAILDPIADKLLLVTSFIVLSIPAISPQPLPRHFPIPFWVTVVVISRDIFIIVGAAAINIVTGFSRFRPSLLGKINTAVQILAIAAILIAASYPSLSGYLPTVYTTVFAFAVLSGVHYIFFASRLVNEERRQNGD